MIDGCCKCCGKEIESQGNALGVGYCTCRNCGYCCWCCPVLAKGDQDDSLHASFCSRAKHGEIRWFFGHPQNTNAAGDPPRGGRAKLHAFLALPGEAQEAAQDVCYDISPICQNKRWTGMVGPEMTNPRQDECCLRCWRKVCAT